MNYNSLRNSVVAYLAYDDLSVGDTIIDDAIALCESRINSELRVKEMMASADLTCSATTGTAALPTDFTEMVALYRTGGGRPIRMEYVTPNEFFNYSATDNRYTISGWVTGSLEGVLVTAIEDESSGLDIALNLHYIQTIPALTSTDTTNWLTTRSPRAYLYGTLMELQPYLANPASYQDFEQKFNLALMDLQHSDLYGANTVGRYGPRIRKQTGENRESKLRLSPPAPPAMDIMDEILNQ